MSSPVIRRPRVYVPRQPWIYRLRIQGYDAEDISVTVDGGKVIIHARHEEVDGEDMDIHETKRSVNVPEYVNKDKLASYLIDGGYLVISAPFHQNTKRTCRDKTDSRTHEKTVEIQHETNTAETTAVRSQNNVPAKATESNTGKHTEESLVSMKAAQDKKNEQEPRTSITDFIVNTEVVNYSDQNSNEKNADEGLVVKTDGQAEEKEKESCIPISDFIINAVTVNHGDQKSGDKLFTEEELDSHDEEVAKLTQSVLEKEMIKYGDAEFAKEYTKHDEISIDDTYVITSVPASPIQSLDNNPVEYNFTEKLEETPNPAEKLDSIATTIPHPTDSTENIEQNGEKFHQITMNLKNFKPKNVSIRVQDNVLFVEAKKVWRNDGIVTTQKVHRQFVVPDGANTDKVSAQMSDDGIVKLLLPVKKPGGSTELENKSKWIIPNTRRKRK